MEIRDFQYCGHIVVTIADYVNSMSDPIEDTVDTYVVSIDNEKLIPALTAWNNSDKTLAVSEFRKAKKGDWISNKWCNVVLDYLDTHYKVKQMHAYIIRRDSSE